MRFYRLHKTTEGGVSAGFEFFTTRRDAEHAAAIYISENPEESAALALIEFGTTKNEIALALNIYAAHPDNG